MWNKFIGENPTYKEHGYEAWAFGDDANLLADLVKSGIKTATASAYPLYEIDNSPLPAIGGFNIILDKDDKAICISQTTRVYTCPFNEVSSDHAFKEGEGDRSLAYWREVHERFFTENLGQYNMTFDENMLVVCEEFKLLYK